MKQVPVDSCHGDAGTNASDVCFHTHLKKKEPNEFSYKVHELTNP
jgi:hypothetical protein